MLVSVSLAAPAAAQQQEEEILFPAVNDAQARILEKIRAERIRLDIATWYLVDGEITQTIINKWQEGVPVRVIGDRVAIFEIDQNTRNSFEQLARAGVPIRLRYFPTDFPSIMHWKAGIFVGQGIVEFGSANWTTFELMPFPGDFKDETAFFTNDSAIVNSFLTQFDRMWADTTDFLDWPEAYLRETGTIWSTPYPTIDRTRLELNHPDPEGMIWSQGSELNTAIAAEIDRESSQIDMVIYRLTDPVISDAVVRRRQANVPVRLMIEPTQYHQPDWPEYWLTGARIDQMWVAGAQIKQRAHQGLTHMKTLITSNVALNGSSNFTRFWQRDHNYFITPQTKPAIHQAFRDRFQAMWNDNTNYTNFYPRAPEPPGLVSPANTATSVSTTPRLEWNRSRWAVAFDVYLGTSQNNLVFQGRVNAQLVEDPPQTYSWTVSQALQPNTIYYWQVVARTFATDVDPSLVAGSAVRSFSTAGGGGGGTSTPYGGTPAVLPGLLEAENFDEGGSGVAYVDFSAGNNGGVYRATDVDVAGAQDGRPNDYTLGWTDAGEWLRYTVNVGTAGNYDLRFRVASGGPGGMFRVEVNGVDRTGAITIPDTGGWQNWTTVTRTGVNLSAGQQVWRVVMISTGVTGAIGNLNYIEVTAAGGGGGGGVSTPYGGSPVPLPGTLQAENFDNGGEGVAYHDLSSINEGGEYRPTAVDIASALDTGGGHTLGWVGAGEWLNYTVNVGTAGTYDIEARVASGGAGGTFHIEINGVDRTGPITIPDTGGWQSWTTVRRLGVSLSAGQQMWRVVMDTNGSTGAIGNINYLRVVSGAVVTAPEIVIYGADVTAGNIHGNWSQVADASAAGGIRLASSDLAAPTISTPLASPVNYFDVTFDAQAGVRYRLWLRLQAANNNKFNDSLWVQFSGSTDSAGNPRYRIGTTAGLNVNLATCSDCALSGWGWQNRGYWEADTGEIWFATTGTQTIRIQIREDGVSLDQIVLSPQQYVDNAPGPVTNDSTIVRK